jgi:hypothetical protein
MSIWAWPLRAFAVTALVAAGACADTGSRTVVGAATADSGRSCFRTADVDSWAAVDRTTLNLRVGINAYYQVKLFAPCGDIDFSQRIGLRSRGTDFICSGLDAEIIAPTPTGPQRCPATSVRRLTADEVKALPGRQKP